MNLKVFFIKNSWWMVSLIALILLLIHTLNSWKLNIDNISLMLLTIILISPFISQIRKIKMGDFEAEIDPKEIQKVKDEVETKLSNETLNENDYPGTKETFENISSLIETDHILALAKLRIELEKIIKKIYFLTVKENSNKITYNVNLKEKKIPGLMTLVYELTLREVLPSDVTSPLKEVIYMCNRAVHGQEISKNDARSIVEIGLSLYKALNSISHDYIIKPSFTEELDPSKLESYIQGNYEVKTIIPYVEEPIINTRIVSQDGLDEFLSNYNEFAEFLISIKFID